MHPRRVLMHHPLIRTLIIAVFLAGFSTVSAQEVRKLTLEELISIGLENNHQLHASEMNVVSSRARLSELNAMRLPSLSFGASYTRLSSIDPFSIETPFGNFDITQDIVNTYNL